MVQVLARYFPFLKNPPSSSYVLAQAPHQILKGSSGGRCSSLPVSAPVGNPVFLHCLSALQIFLGFSFLIQDSLALWTVLQCCLKILLWFMPVLVFKFVIESSGKAGFVKFKRLISNAHFATIFLYLNTMQVQYLRNNDCPLKHGSVFLTILNALCISTNTLEQGGSAVIVYSLLLTASHRPSTR